MVYTKKKYGGLGQRSRSRSRSRERQRQRPGERDERRSRSRERQRPRERPRYAENENQRPNNSPVTGSNYPAPGAAANEGYYANESQPLGDLNNEDLPKAPVNPPHPHPPPPPPASGPFGRGNLRMYDPNTGFSEQQAQQLQHDRELQEIKFKELVYYKIIHYKKCLKAIQDAQDKQQQDIDRVTQILTALSETPSEIIDKYNTIVKQGAELLNDGARAAEEGQSTKRVDTRILELADQAIDLTTIYQQDDNIYRLPIYTICISVLSQLIVVNTRRGRASTDINPQELKLNISKSIIDNLKVQIKDRLNGPTQVDRKGFEDLLSISVVEAFKPYNKRVIFGQGTVAISENMNFIISHLIDTLISVNITLETIQMKYTDGNANIEEIKRKIKHLCIPYIDIFARSRQQLIQKYDNITQNPTAFMVDTIMTLKNLRIKDLENYIKLLGLIPSATVMQVENLFGTINKTIKGIFESILYSTTYNDFLLLFNLEDETNLEGFTCPSDEHEIQDKLTKWKSVRGMTLGEALEVAQLSNVDGLYGGSRKTKTPKRKQRKSKKTKTPKRKQRKSRKQRKRTRKSC